jgi:two-component system sensor histidine kinase/response regulator
VRVCLTKPARQSRLYNAIVETLAGPASTAPSDGREPQAPARTATGAKILVVEDNHVNQAVAVGMLERRGYRVELAANGREALAALARSGYDAVLMDCQMPEMDGYQATAEIRRREAEGRHTPIVAMTAHSMTGDRERCLAAGMDDYLAKPLRAEELDGALARWIPDSATASPLDPVAAGPPADVIDREVLGRLCAELGDAGRGPRFADLLDRFLQDAAQRLAGMAGAVSDRDATTVEQQAHALKGAAATFGAVRLARLSAEMEGAARDLATARALLPQLEAALADSRTAFGTRDEAAA